MSSDFLLGGRYSVFLSPAPNCRHIRSPRFRVVYFAASSSAVSTGRTGGKEEDERAVVLPMASAENLCGVVEGYIDLDSPMGTNLYVTVCYRLVKNFPTCSRTE